MKNAIVLKNISVSYGSSDILNNVSLSIESDYPTCIIGKGSSGKTTLLKTILGLVKLKKGKIIIKENMNNNSNNFGVVFQKDALFDSLLVWQNVMFQSLESENDNKLIIKTKRILKSVGLSPQDAFLMPNELSGGMRKRVAIARAISHDPKFLILDEPTAGLDPIKSTLIFNIITKLNKERKMTILAVSSDMKGAIKYFKQLIFLDSKRVHWKGKPSEALKEPTKLVGEFLAKV
jgi:phospholipid/cholesterol/gamma-HCH transport system ATP-binding protein